MLICLECIIIFKIPYVFKTWWRGCLDESVPASGGLLISIECTATMFEPVKHST